jgi:nucleoside phosphorylase
MTVLILTPLPIEFKSVIRHLTELEEPVYHDQAAYEAGKFIGKHHSYRVIVCEPGMKNVDMALAAERAIKRFNPEVALLVGIAAGVKDVGIGDVLVAKKAYAYEPGKEDEEGFKARPVAESFSRELLARAQVLSRREDWKKRTMDGALEAQVYLGPIAAGDKVVASVHNSTYRSIKLHFNDTLGLEMEAYGFATALQGNPTVHGLVIRGISDLCEGKAEADKQNWQSVAADRAAGFGFELLEEIDFSSIIIPVMDAKTLAKEIYGLLFPMPESVKEIGNDFANAVNNEIREIWKRVKPLLKHELEDLQINPHDSDLQGAVRTKLKYALMDNSDLMNDINTFINKIYDQNVYLKKTENKNAIINSSVKVKGNFHLGDINNKQ